MTIITKVKGRLFGTVYRSECK